MNRRGRAYLGLGSNLGDRHGHLRGAIAELAADASCTVTGVSSFYESDALGEGSGPRFLNAAAAVCWAQSPRQLLSLCQRIEGLHGRTRPYANAPRSLDIDILFWEGFTSTDPDLTIPHPQLLNRGFALLPLLEIAPHLVDPTTHAPLSAHLNTELLNQGIQSILPERLRV